MADVVEQLCTQSYGLTAQNGDHAEVKQGNVYTTSVPSDDKDNVTVFTAYWFPVPKEYFVLMEKPE